MWFGIITLFPEMFQMLNAGITGRALQQQLISLNCFNPRDFTEDKHKTVDDKPYGGGPGMVMMAGPLQAAIAKAKQSAVSSPTVIYLSPQGKMFTQARAQSWLKQKALIFLAGRYEGIDERIIEQVVDEECSIGDYVLSGGELASMVIIDTLTRLIPGAVGDHASVLQDSLTSGLLKYPQYTRPELFSGKKVPEVLLSGNHQVISQWRRKQALGRTWLRRPDLLEKNQLTPADKVLLRAFIEELTQIELEKQHENG